MSVTIDRCLHQGGKLHSFSQLNIFQAIAYGAPFVSKFLWHSMDKNRFDVYKNPLNF